MRSTVLILAGALTLAGTRLHAQTPVPAQPPITRSPGAAPVGRHHGGRGMLMRGLSLSKDQRAQLKAIHTRYRDERQSARGTGAAQDAASRATLHSQARAMHERELADIRNVLTPAQQATFDQNVAAWRAQRGSRRAAR